MMYLLVVYMSTAHVELPEVKYEVSASSVWWLLGGKL